MPTQKEGLRPIWQLLITVVTSLTTILVTYIAAVKPATDAQVRDRIDKREAAVAQGVPVAINTAPIQNDTGFRLLIIGFCNATPQSKEIEAFVGPNSKELTLVASGSGGDRLTVTCVVPTGWYYRIRYAGAGSSDVTAWKL